MLQSFAERWLEAAECEVESKMPWSYRQLSELEEPYTSSQCDPSHRLLPWAIPCISRDDSLETLIDRLPVNI